METLKYAPVLKWKQGEQFALLNLNESIKGQILPIICLMNLNGDPIDEIRKIIKFWGTNYPVCIGFHNNLYKDNVMALREYMNELIKGAFNAGVRFIPVISSLNSKEYLETLSNLKDYLPNGIMMQFKNKEFNVIKEAIEKFSKNYSFNANEILVQLDYFMVDSNIDSTTYADIAFNSIDKINLTDYKAVIFTAASFPTAILGLEANSITPISRHEWLIWKEIVKKHKDIIYGDYCSDDPLDQDLTFGATIIPTIRYTKNDFWYIVRGKHDKTRPRDFSQFHVLSKKLIARSDIYCGRGYSWGDNEIEECANKICTGSKKCNHGHMGEWVKRNSNHHMTYVVNQVSEFLDSLR